MLMWAILGLLLVTGLVYFALRGRPVRETSPPATPPVPQPVAAPQQPVVEQPEETAGQSPTAAPPAPSLSPPASRSALRVTSVSPTSKTFNYRDSPIEVEFSIPVKQETVPPVFKVNPPMAGTFSWPTPTKVVFTPRGMWEQSGTYLVTLGDGITDVNGVDRLEATSWDFSIVGGYFYTRDIRPLVAAHCTSCHRPDGPAARIRLDTLADIMRFVQSGDADKSRFVSVLSDQNHQGKLPPSAVAKTYIFRDWISVFKAND